MLVVRTRKLSGGLNLRQRIEGRHDAARTSLRVLRWGMFSTSGEGLLCVFRKDGVYKLFRKRYVTLLRASGARRTPLSSTPFIQ